MRAALRPIAVALALAPCACSLLLDESAQQCATDDDCHRRGAAFASAVCVDHLCQDSATAAWGCLDHPTSPPAATSSTVNVTLALFDQVQPSNKVAGITVRACARLDVTCNAPLGPAVQSDADGNAMLTLPAGFDGFLELQGSGTMPALWYFSPTPTKDRTYSVGLLSPTSFNQIAQAVGATIDANAGHTFDFALDCSATYGSFARDVTFDADHTTKETKGFYLANGLPSTSATQTDASGIGGFANLPPGVLTVTTSLAGSGRKVGSASILVRAGTITYTAIAPGP